MNDFAVLITLSRFRRTPRPKAREALTFALHEHFYFFPFFLAAAGFFDADFFAAGFLGLFVIVCRTLHQRVKEGNAFRLRLLSHAPHYPSPNCDPTRPSSCATWKPLIHDPIEHILSKQRSGRGLRLAPHRAPYRDIARPGKRRTFLISAAGGSGSAAGLGADFLAAGLAFGGILPASVKQRTQCVVAVGRRQRGP